MKIGYVIAAYFGQRDSCHDNQSIDYLFYIKTQINSINNLNTNISKIYIVCTNSYDIDMNPISQYLANLTYIDNRIHIIYRDNFGGSYCSWQDVLNIDNGECDYIFLMEDDYILYNKNSVKLLLKYWDEHPDLLYLCQYWTDIPYESQMGIIPNHAAISNGLLNNKLYHKIRTEKNIQFLLEYTSGKHVMCKNQALFLEQFRRDGYKMMDICEKYSSPFNNILGETLEYGKPNAEIIFAPISNQFFNSNKNIKIVL